MCVTLRVGNTDSCFQRAAKPLAHGKYALVGQSSSEGLIALAIVGHRIERRDVDPSASSGDVVSMDDLDDFFEVEHDEDIMPELEHDEDHMPELEHVMPEFGDAIALAVAVLAEAMVVSAPVLEPPAARLGIRAARVWAQRAPGEASLYGRPSQRSRQQHMGLSRLMVQCRKEKRMCDQVVVAQAELQAQTGPQSNAHARCLALSYSANHNTTSLAREHCVSRAGARRMIQATAWTHMQAQDDWCDQMEQQVLRDNMFFETFWEKESWDEARQTFVVKLTDLISRDVPKPPVEVEGQAQPKKGAKGKTTKQLQQEEELKAVRAAQEDAGSWFDGAPNPSAPARSSSSRSSSAMKSMPTVHKPAVSNRPPKKLADGDAQVGVKRKATSVPSTSDGCGWKERQAKARKLDSVSGVRRTAQTLLMHFADPEIVCNMTPESFRKAAINLGKKEDSDIFEHMKDMTGGLTTEGLELKKALQDEHNQLSLCESVQVHVRASDADFTPREAARAVNTCTEAGVHMPPNYPALFYQKLAKHYVALQANTKFASLLVGSEEHCFTLAKAAQGGQAKFQLLEDCVYHALTTAWWNKAAPHVAEELLAELIAIRSELPPETVTALDLVHAVSQDPARVTRSLEEWQRART